MIPLRTTENSEKFPYPTVYLVLLYLVCELIARLWPGSHRDFLLRVAFVPDQSAHWSALLSFLFYPHVYSLLVGILFMWVFTPRLFARRGVLAVSLLGLSGAALALFSFRWIHPYSEAPMLCSDAFVGALLGAFMRRDIWGSVSTLVIGPGWLRVFEVPSYVLLFFWFFYLFLGNLFLPDPFSNAPMLYWLPFVAFLWGFAVESLLAHGTEQDPPTNSAA